MSTVKKLARRCRRNLWEWAGSDRYSWPGLHGLDRKIDAILNRDAGYFVEAGANDGYEQSNTYYLERFRCWTGLLIEPVPALARDCRRNRPSATVVETALVDSRYRDSVIALDPGGLTTTVRGAFDDEVQRRDHHLAGLAVQGITESPTISVAATTLTAVLERFGAPQCFDLLSLDVEGYEEQVLDGLDFEKYRPQYMCIEIRDIKRIESIIGQYYVREAVLLDAGERQDVLYRSRQLANR